MSELNEQTEQTAAAKRCAGCNFLKWDTTPEQRQYVCRHFGRITGPATSSCVRWQARAADWTHAPGRQEAIGPGVYAVALNIGLPPSGHRELCALPDFPAIVTGSDAEAHLKVSHAKLLTWLECEAGISSEEVRIC